MFQNKGRTSFRPVLLILTAVICMLLVTLGGITVRAAEEEQFQFEVTVTEASKSFNIPTNGYLGGSYNKTYNWKVNWGDGTDGTYSNVSNSDGEAISTNAALAEGIPHTYQTAGTYLITITPVGSTDAWLGAFGFASSTGNANNRAKVTKVISPLTCRMTRTQTQITNNVAPTYEWAYTFYGCTNITMGDEFNLPQDVSKVGNNFASYMFYNCSGTGFRMNEEFNLPQDLSSVGTYFASNMFSNCSGTGFSMNEEFNLPQDLSSVGAYFAHYMFNNCSGARFSMNEEFNLPQELLTVGDAFASCMFRDCSGTGFSMNEAFNLPQNLSTVGASFASYMFFGCSGDGFGMNEEFNLPQDLTTVGTSFADSMFYGCSGTGFSMNEEFNLPQDLITVGTYFAAEMFNGCSGPGFNMNEEFNLPQYLTTIGTAFAINMFANAGGVDFQINDIFCFPQLSFTDLNRSNNFNNTFGNLAVGTPVQNRSALSILNGNDIPDSDKSTFTDSSAVFKDYNYVPLRWGGGGANQEYLIVCTQQELAFPAAEYLYLEQSTKIITVNNYGMKKLLGVSAALASGSEYFELVTAPASTLASGCSGSVLIRPRTGLVGGNYTGVVSITGDNAQPCEISLSFKVIVDTDLTSLSLSKNDETAIMVAPAFDSEVLEYLAVVDSDVTQIQLKAIPSDTDNATMSLRQGDEPGTAAGISESAVTLDLESGDNKFYITVTGEDGTSTKTYLLTVKRPAVLTTAYNPSGTLSDLQLAAGYSWVDDETSVGDVTANGRSFAGIYSDGTNSWAINLLVIVEKAIPSYTVPSNLTAFYGDTLADVVLPNRWAFTAAATTSVGAIGDNTFTVIFTPDDTTNYQTVEKSVTITVGKAIPSYTVPSNLTAVYGDTLGDVALDAGWTFADVLTTSVGNAGYNTFTVIFTPSDTANYQTVERSVTISVDKAAPHYVLPTNLSAYYGQRLSTVALPAGFSFKAAAGTTVGVVGTNSFAARYTPADSNYKTVDVTLQIKVTAKKANQPQSGIMVKLNAGNGYIYNGKYRKPQVVVTDGKQVLRKGTDYTVSYKNNRSVGVASAIVKMRGNYSGTLTETFVIKPAAQKISSVPKSITQTYGSKAYILKPKISGSGTITYASSNRNVATVGKKNGKITAKGYGKTTITITATSKNYKKVTKKVTVTITPKQAELMSVVSNTIGALDICWKTDKYAKGYLITYSTDASFTQNKNSVIITGKAVTNRTITGLNTGTIYYVKVQSYTTINGKNVFGKASAVQSAKTKKGGYIVNCHSLKVRSGPATSYGIVDYIQYGDSFELLETCTYNDYPGGYVWYKISYAGKTGYIYCKYGDII